MRQRALLLLACAFVTVAVVLALLRGRGTPVGKQKQRAKWAFQPLTLPPGEAEDVAIRGDTILVAMKSPRGGRVYRSRDGGRAWEPLDIATSSGQWFALSPEFERDGTAVLVNAGEDVYLSRDSGDSWEKISGWLNPRAIALSPGENPAVYMATFRFGESHHLYIWEPNRGWELALEDSSPGTYGGFLQVLAFSSEEAILLVSHDTGGDWHTELWRTEDGWKSWSRGRGFPHDGVGEIVSAGEYGLVVPSAEGTLYYSPDRGMSWHPLAHLPEHPLSGLSGAGELLVASVDKDGETLLLRLEGQNWVELEGTPHISCCGIPLAVSPDELYIFATPRFLARGVRQ